ncbi:MAG: hypothetical protein Q8W51_06270 [Candidatus Palauibacterales bacterium]|nr:hypothetical protein [Candidatus Palauibacterales bacterium]MDP2529323.1 hypothetical protein [Candidatus Palauibacterales bacterium]MDP2583270.1 hypothetical protein [Candidatus Palauibacterales bacterium]
MTHETITTLSPAEVLTEAREFFTGRHPICPASIESESDSHITFNTFRSRITVAAFPDPRGEAPTRVRASTLREDAVAARFVSAIGSVGRARAAAGSGAGE